MDLNLFLEYFFILITNFGNPFFLILISALLYWMGKETESFFFMNTIVAAGISSSFFKSAFKAPRPQNVSDLAEYFEKIFFAPGNDFSFPSGHAAQVSAAYSFFFDGLKKNWKIIFAAIVVLVLASRVFLGKHYLIDVLGGLLLGLIVGRLVFFAKKWFEKNAKLNARSERFFGLFAVLVIAVAVVFLFETLLVVMIAIGYYAGIFLFKEIGKDSQKIAGKKFLAKSVMGTAGILAFLGLAVFAESFALRAVLLFFAGFWITLLFPLLFEIITLKKPTKHKK